MNEYVVKSGDTLSKIAGMIWGDPMRYPELYAHNPWINKETNLIRVGDVIRYPATGTQTASTNASITGQLSSQKEEKKPLNMNLVYAGVGGVIVLGSLLFLKPKS